jgi:hypothetical protein
MGLNQALITVMIEKDGSGMETVHVEPRNRSHVAETGYGD